MKEYEDHESAGKANSKLGVMKLFWGPIWVSTIEGPTFPMDKATWMS
jgi:hypothetical protein